MKSRSLLLWLALTSAASLQAGTGSFALETRFFVFRNADFHSPSLMGKSVSAFGRSVVFNGAVQANFDGNILSLAGDDPSWSAGSAPAAFSFVSTPPALIDPAHSVSLNSSVPIQYEEAQPDGTLKLHTIAADSPDAPHCRIRVGLEGIAPVTGTLTIGCNIDIATVQSRSPVPGVSLPVGKPDLASLSNIVSFNVAPGKWSALMLRGPKDSAYSLVLFLRLTPELSGETQFNRVAVAHLQVPRYGAAVVTDGRYIYAEGGRNAMGILDSLERFDTQTGKGMVMPTKLLQRFNHNAVVLNGKLYLLGGGRESANFEDALEIVDLASDTVTRGAPMPRPARNFVAAAVNGKIYTYGGQERDGGQMGISRRLQIYDPIANTWSDGPTAPTARTTRAAVVYDEQLVILGGHRPPSTHTGLKTVECYVPEANNWYLMKDLSAPFDMVAVARVADRTYLFGNTGYHEDVYEYNLTTGATLALKSNYTPVVSAGAVTVGHNVYLVGGSTEDGPRLALETSDMIQIFMAARSP